ncbi:BatA domain-containing protein [bacterium]|nr:BatA domain-containing protein [bacterium]
MGLTFLNSTFLFAALAALLPLIIHMLSRRQVKTVDFSSLLFLKELERRKIRRVRIRQVLLLIIRSLIILCAALAIARPTLSGLGVGAASHAKTSVAVVLDTSASMGRRSDDGLLFDEALERAHEIADLLGNGDEAFLVGAGVPVDELLPTGTFSVDVFREAINELAPTPAGTDYTTAVARALILLTESRNLNRELYVIGDMQRSGWEGELGGALVGSSESSGDPRTSADDLRTLVDGETREAQKRVRGFLLPVNGRLGNRSAGDVRVEHRYGGQAGAHTVTVRVTNHGSVAADIPVRLVVDDVHVGQSGVSLDAGRTGSVSFSTVVDEASWHSGRVELPADVLDVDNVRYFVIPPSLRMNVLIVNAAGAVDERDGYYIKRALDPTGGREPFACAEVPAPALVHQEQSRFDVVILADAGRLDADGERWLLEHIERGGGVTLVLGKRTDVRYWNERLLKELGFGAIIEPVERRNGLRVAPASSGHPLLAGLVHGERLIDDAYVTRAFRAGAGSAEVVLEMPGVGPLLAMGKPARGGRSAVLYTGVDSAWSDLPKSGLLVPIMHRLIRDLAGSRAATASAAVGGDIIVPYEASRRGAPQAVRPDGVTVTAERLVGAAGGAMLREVAQTGVYRFPDGGGDVLAAVNVPERESELSAASRDEIEEAVGGGMWTTIQPDASLAAAILVSRHGRELWRVLVYAALVLVALEMWVARPRL